MKGGLKVLSIIFILLTIASCNKERPKPSWDVDLLSPLLLDTIRITDVISDTLITTNPDYSVSFVFDEKLYEVNVDSLVKLPDTLFNFSFGLKYLPNPISLNPGDTIIKEVFDWPLDFESFDLSGVKMEEAWIRSGNVIFEVYNQSQSDLLSDFGINSAIRNETDTFYVSEKVPAGEQIAKSFDFSGYHLNLKGMETDTFNLLNYYLALIVHPDEPGPVTLTPADSFSVNVYFDNIILDYGRGYMGRNIHQIGPEQYPFTFFDELNLQGFSIDEAKVNLVVENTYGIESYLQIKNITATNNTTGESATLQGNLVNTDLFVDRATEEQPGSGIVNPFFANFDFSNSNFPALFSILPDQLSYTLSVETNVLEDSTHYNNFFYYDQPIKLYAQVDINQGVNIKDMFVESTEDWNGSNVKLDKVQSGKLVLQYTNGFPFSFNINMFLEDSVHTVLDTLFYDEFLEAGLLNNEMRVAEPISTRIEVPLTDNLKDAVHQATRAHYQILINSAQNQQVKIYSTDILQLKIIGDFKYLIEQ